MTCNGGRKHHQMTTTWKPEEFLNYNEIPDGEYALIILNRPMRIVPNLVIQLWNKAFYRVTVDGGTDVWLDFKSSYCSSIPVKDIDLITGDFDSISDEALQLVQMCYKDKVVCTPDQDETDFTKALRTVDPFIGNTDVKSIVVIAESSGRIDQIMANINTLHKAHELCCVPRIFVLAHNSLSFLIRPGKHRITIIQSLVDKQDWCALMPFSETATVTTTGLKWNLQDQKLQFGGLVTTSNTYVNNEVNIITDKPLLWAMGITKM